MRGIRLEDRLLLVAQTGKGKTTLARWICEQLQPLRVIAFDPKDELFFPGVTPARTPAELVQAMHQPLVHYVPSGFERDELEEACQIVWETPGPWIWWVDELSELTGPNYCPAGLRLAVTQGRQKYKMVLGLTQRLAECHPVFRSQSEHIIIFTPPPVELDLKMVSGNVRREAALLDHELAALHAEHGDYSHLWYVRSTDELRRCLPLELPGGSPRQLPAPAGTPQQPPAPEGGCEPLLAATADAEQPPESLP